MRSISLRAGSGLLIALLALACELPGTKQSAGSTGTGGGGATGATSASAPVIDDLEMPTLATAGDDGYYTIEGWISFHDPDNAVHSIRMYVVPSGQTFDFSAGDVQSVQGTPLLLRFVADFPLLHRGDTTYQLSLVDASGAVGAPVTRTVNLQ